MIDTSALIAALIVDHEHHDVARPQVREVDRVPAIVLAETFAQLRRTFRQPAVVAAAMMAPWARPECALPTSAAATHGVLARAVELDLGGNVHDALIAMVCLEHSVPLHTLDRRQHTLALALGADSTYLLA